jgi:hypothetical protein
MEEFILDNQTKDAVVNALSIAIHPHVSFKQVHELILIIQQLPKKEAPIPVPKGE